MRLALACLLGLASLAALPGCLGDGPRAEPEVDLGPVEEGRISAGADLEGPQEVSTGFGWAAAVAVPGIGTDVRFVTTFPDTIGVDDGRSVLYANVTWACLAPRCDLHGWLCGPEERSDPLSVVTDCALHDVGAGPFSFVAEQPMAGEWTVVLASDGPTAGLEGTVDFYAA